MNSAYTDSVQRLVDNINGRSRLCLFNDAKTFFSTHSADTTDLAERKQQLAELQQQQAETPKSKAIATELKAAQQEVAAKETLLKNQRIARLEKVLKVLSELLKLTEGEDYDDTLFKSSKMLGTLLLMSPCNGKNLAHRHQRLKPVYKAVLSMRVLDELMRSEKVTHPHIVTYWQAEQRYKCTDFRSNDLRQAVVLPVLLCAIFQDVGMQHPEVHKLLYGEGDLDPFRILAKEDRQKLLKLNYKYAQWYLSEGLGMQHYTGDSKAQRDGMVKTEQARMVFQKSLLKDANLQSSSLGEIIKVPQIYSSVVLSTKPDFKYSDLPKASLLIEQMASKKLISQFSATVFGELVGQFPQGYGVCLVPKDQSVKGFEFAVVVRLNPKHKQKPKCKIVSKKQVFVTTGETLIVEQGQNFHFPNARKRFSYVDDSRVTEIRGALSHNFDPEDQANPTPPCWNPHDFFINRGIQNLWSKSDTFVG